MIWYDTALLENTTVYLIVQLFWSPDVKITETHKTPGNKEQSINTVSEVGNFKHNDRALSMAH